MAKCLTGGPTRCACCVNEVRSPWKPRRDAGFRHASAALAARALTQAMVECRSHDCQKIATRDNARRPRLVWPERVYPCRGPCPNPDYPLLLLFRPSTNRAGVALAFLLTGANIRLGLANGAFSRSSIAPRLLLVSKIFFFFKRVNWVVRALS